MEACLRTVKIGECGEYKAVENTSRRQWMMNNNNSIKSSTEKLGCEEL